MLNLKPFFFLLLFSSVGFSQSDRFLYDNDLLTKEFHKGRREALRALMADNSVAVFFAAPVRNKSNDVYYTYHQDPNFYYLTGFTESDAVLVIFKTLQDFSGNVTDELLFVPERNPGVEAWTGRRLGVDGAITHLGFQYPMVNKNFAEYDISFSSFDKVYHMPFNEDIKDQKDNTGDLYSLISHFKAKTGYEKKNKDNSALKEMMASLREKKLPEEMILLRKAINITCNAQLELMKALEPAMTEYQSEAILEYFFKTNGSEKVGFPSIVGGGENSCILHYTANRKRLDNKDLLVSDVGAEYHGYTADVTRTIPVNGKFSKQQKIIYEIVLEAQLAGINACTVGNEFRAPHKAAMAVIQKRLLELEIIKKPEEAQKYFFHGTSHYLGLDVHDAGLYGKLAAGNVITVEPGIYIPAGSECDLQWWNIGVRIEDDILITDTAPEVLSSAVPKLVSEIEAIMKLPGTINVK